MYAYNPSRSPIQKGGFGLEPPSGWFGKKAIIIIVGFLVVVGGVGSLFMFGIVSFGSVPQEEHDSEEIAFHELPDQMEEKEPEHHPDSLPAMFEKEFSGSTFSVGNVLEKTDSYTRYYITYKSEGGLLISGIMNKPSGDGPFPVLILNHGYIDPVVYTNGRGLKREQDYFASRGYVVIHPDYRGHADSDPDPDGDIRPRTGYTEDVLNVLYALEEAKLSYVDLERVGMLGHSMGGGVALNVMVTKPELVDAYVLFAPISPTYKDNFERYVREGYEEDFIQLIFDRYGTFDANPLFWASVSAVNYFNRVRAPVMIHHGTNDADVPLVWSQTTRDQLQDSGVLVSYYEYTGEGHEFINQWPRVMKRTLDFFEEHLSAGSKSQVSGDSVEATSNKKQGTDKKEDTDKKQVSEKEDETEVEEKEAWIEFKDKFVSSGFSKGRSEEIDTIILHSVYNKLGGDQYSVSKILDIFDEYSVSAHYIIDREGTVYRLVKESDTSWHAGVASVPDGRTNVNDFSVGIELINAEDDEYTKEQYSAIRALVSDLQSRYEIKYLLGHDEIAPGRKSDPWNFDWSILDR